MIIRYLYPIFLGILLALFVGVGISAFYISPVSPQPSVSQPVPVGAKGEMSQQQSQEMARQEALQQKQFADYTEKLKIYNRNVSIISLVCAVLFVITSVWILEKKIILTDGFLLGGLCTLIYSIIRGFESDDSKFRFIVVTVSLLIVLFLGYKKFLLTSLPAGKKK